MDEALGTLWETLRCKINRDHNKLHYVCFPPTRFQNQATKCIIFQRKNCKRKVLTQDLMEEIQQLVLLVLAEIDFAYKMRIRQAIS